VSKLALLDRSADSTTVRQYLSMMKYSKGQKEQVNIRVRRIIIGFLEVRRCFIFIFKYYLSYMLIFLVL